MGDFLSKFENFLFDILGLVLPGFIFILLLSSPLLFFEFKNVPPKKLNSSILLSTLNILCNSIQEFPHLNIYLSIGVIVISSYILGHLVKVFSIIQYEIFTAIFDKNINKLIRYLYDSILLKIKNFYKKVTNKEFDMTLFYKQMKYLWQPIKNTVSKIFVFGPPPYNKENEIMKSKCIEIINQKFNTNYPDVWYSLYKFSTVINIQENIKSLSGNFLAKYNLYRSLSFIFVTLIIYFITFFYVSNEFLKPTILNLKGTIMILSVLLWFTFHYKYKRYWTLCGNETLVSLFYFLNKKSLNDTPATAG